MFYGLQTSVGHHMHQRKEIKWRPSKWVEFFVYIFKNHFILEKNFKTFRNLAEIDKTVACLLLDIDP